MVSASLNAGPQTGPPADQLFRPGCVSSGRVLFRHSLSTLAKGRSGYQRNGFKYYFYCEKNCRYLKLMFLLFCPVYAYNIIKIFCFLFSSGVITVKQQFVLLNLGIWWLVLALVRGSTDRNSAVSAQILVALLSTTRQWMSHFCVHCTVSLRTFCRTRRCFPWTRPLSSPR